MATVNNINFLPELSRVITRVTGERVTHLSGIRPGVFDVQLASGCYVVKIRRMSPRLLGEQKVLQSLGHFGVPTEQLLDIWQLDDEYALCRFSYLNGDPWLLDAAMTGAHQVGRLMGALHQGLATTPSEAGFPVANLPAAIFHTVVPALVQTERPTLMVLKKKLLDAEDSLWDLQGLPQQLIHRDAHIGNMLFRDTVFSGWVDFDMLETNFRIFDVSYYAAGLLAAQFTNLAWRTQWMSVVRTMVDAYGDIVRLTSAEVEAVWMAMIAIEALFLGLSLPRDVRNAESNAAICHWLFEQRDHW
jgi:Ser/Thr protein kinase RdoA (MazF antagonist)